MFVVPETGRLLLPVDEKMFETMNKTIPTWTSTIANFNLEVL